MSSSIRFLLLIAMISMYVQAKPQHPDSLQYIAKGICPPGTCCCNGNSEYDFSLGKEIGNCGEFSCYPLGSANCRHWCYVDQFASGCTDIEHKPIRKRWISYEACAPAKLK